MSLPPVQSLLPEVQKKTPIVTKPEPAHNEQQRGFKGSMDSARQDQTDQANKRANTDKQSGDVKVANKEASDNGNDLPPEDSEVDNPLTTTSSDLVEAETNTLVLQLGGEALDPAQTDQAVLLAASFVVDSLPRTTKDATADLELTSSLNANKPEVLMRLQALTGQLAAPVVPTRQVADGLTLENLENGVLKELGKASVLDAGELKSQTVDGLTSQSNNLDAKLQAAAAKTELVVPNRVGTTDWSEAMAGRITLMVNQKISSARIHINPPELGPIEVRVNLNHDQASVQFTSQSSQVRDALEQSIPRLRDMLENAGFSLADSGVNDQPQQGFNQSGGGQSGKGEGNSEEQVAKVDTRQSIGLVDDYV
jgi:flagellar hook-length control protein FliK